MSQTFDGSKLSLMDDPLGVGVADDAGAGRSHHSLLLCRDDEEDGPDALYVEFNDQSNACYGANVALIELSDTLLRLRFKAGSPLRGGRVGEKSSAALDELVVRLLLSPKDLQVLRERLASVVDRACPFRYVGHKLGSSEP
jgi:hypothetical protein